MHLQPSWACCLFRGSSLGQAESATRVALCDVCQSDGGNLIIWTQLVGVRKPGPCAM